MSSCLRSAAAPSTSSSPAIFRSCGIGVLCSVRMSSIGALSRSGEAGSSTSFGRSFGSIVGVT